MHYTATIYTTNTTTDRYQNIKVGDCVGTHSLLVLAYDNKQTMLLAQELSHFEIQMKRYP